jgi:hypothetical protein
VHLSSDADIVQCNMNARPSFGILGSCFFRSALGLRRRSSRGGGKRKSQFDNQLGFAITRNAPVVPPS